MGMRAVLVAAGALLFSGGVDPVHSRELSSTLSKVNAVVGGKFQHAVNPDRTDDFVLTVGAMSAGGFTERMTRFPAERLLVVSGDRPTIQLPALEMGVRALVRRDPGVYIEEKNIPIIAYFFALIPIHIKRS